MNMAGKRPYIYLPIEIKVRELHGKLLFALIAADNGFNVILGSQKDIREHLHSFPAGLYLDKSIASTKIKWFNYFKKFNNLLAAWDEEGLIIHEDTYLNRRFSGEAYEMTEKVFAWGKVQAELIRNRYPNTQHKVVLTGNPRFDMLRPEVRGFYSSNVEKLKKQFGSMILINTNFGFYNHAGGSDRGKKIFNKSVSSLDASFIDEWIEFQKKTFENFAAILPELSKCFPNHSIILRAHPVENHDVWRKIADKCERVYVIHEGNVIEWLLAADVVIHSSCSTGVEAFLADRPVIAFRPVLSNQFEPHLPNMLSKQVFSIDELVIVLQKILQKNHKIIREEKDERLKTAEKYIDALNGPLASERIVKVIKKMNLTPQELNLPFFQRFSRKIINFGPLVKRTALNVKNKYIIPKYAEQTHQGKTIAKIEDALIKQTCPDLSLDDLHGSIHKFQQVLNCFNSVCIEQVKPNCFLISNPDIL